MSIKYPPASLASLVTASLLVAVAFNSSTSGADAVRWRDSLDGAKVEAAQSGKLVLLHFYTSSCGPCRMLDENVFSQPQVGDAMEGSYIPIKIDAENSPASPRPTKSNAFLRKWCSMPGAMSSRNFRAPRIRRTIWRN